MIESVRTPGARNTDPITSHLADCEVQVSGVRGKQQRRVLSAVVLFPGHTSRELSGFCDLDRYQVARRLPELQALGVVKAGEIRKCKDGGKPSVTWWPVLEGR
jgi:CRP-like cAMP-binding protein